MVCRKTNSIPTLLLKHADGELFFGGVNGASSFYPGAVTGVNEKPEVLLTSIMIKDQTLAGRQRQLEH